MIEARDIRWLAGRVIWFAAGWVVAVAVWQLLGWCTPPGIGPGPLP